MEMVELKDHPFFVGVQFHPEYLSRVLQPSPPYLGLVAASAGLLQQVLNKPKSMAGLTNGHNGLNGVMVNGDRKVSL